MCGWHNKFSFKTNRAKGFSTRVEKIYIKI